ncbi:MAG: metallopeptidase family protein [Nocardioides sp.]
MSSRIRDRRGRGPRGPRVLPATSPGALRARPQPGRRERFDTLVLGIVADVDERWQQRLGLVEYAVEDTPLVPDDWGDEAVPLSSLIRGTGSRPTRLVLFRRPIEHRAGSREELEALVLTVVVEQVAELLGIDAEDVDPRYRAD